MRLFTKLPFFVALSITAVACGGRAVDVGDEKTQPGDSETAASSSASSSPATPAASADAENPALASLDTLAKTSATCTLDDVRGPFTSFSDGPLTALGLDCPAAGTACYRSNVPNEDLVVCRGADGKVQCASSFGQTVGEQYGYDCCIKDGWSDPSQTTYQCYWLK
jgi:hypothetical protein